MKAIHLENISVVLGKKTILKSLNVSFEAGLKFAVLGRNGSGKTTLLKLLSQQIQPSTGSIRIETEQGASANFKSDLGIVFQKPALDAKLSASENMRLTCKLYGVSCDTQKIIYFLERVGMAENANALVGTLSGGQQRRVDLARALVTNPTILMLDEPTNGLDTLATEQFWYALDSFKGTLIFTSHKHEEADKCDVFVFLEQGMNLCKSTPDLMRRDTKSDVLELSLNVPPDHTIIDTLQSLNMGHWQISENMVSVNLTDGHNKIPLIFDSPIAGHIASVKLRKISLFDILYEKYGISAQT